jgi:PAS domain S-box-containing protein
MTNPDEARASGRSRRRRHTDTAAGGEERFRLIVDNIQDYAILMLDPQGRVMTWNAGARSILGYDASEILGEHFSRFHPPEAIGRGWPERELQLALAQQRFEDEGWRVRKDGTRFWANVVITVMRDDAGEPIGFSKISRDLTERRKHEEALRESQEYFRLLVDGVKDYAIFRLDPDGQVMSWNTGAQRIKGYRAEEIIGRHFSIFYPSEAIQARWPDRELVLAREEGRFEDENWRLRKDGTRFWANVVITPLHDSEGGLLGFAKVTRDMTQRRRIDALEESERQTNEFLAMLAHELRNPLAPIRNAIVDTHAPARRSQPAVVA